MKGIKLPHLHGYLLILLLIIGGCSKDSEPGLQEPPTSPAPEISYNYLALGDSYTIGEAVCGSCGFPPQLTGAMENRLEANIGLRVIARTGWTTSDLLSAIDRANPTSDQDLVTLLIGVNNQFRGIPFSVYEEELQLLIEEAIRLAGGRPEAVILVSIPDYAFTPFGQSTGNPQQISEQLNRYNDYAKDTATDYGIRYVNITDITRQGLNRPELVAGDGLHPSETAYAEFVDRLLPVALSILRN